MSNNKQQTAINQIIEQQQHLLNELKFGAIEMDEYEYFLSLVFEQAKAMHKEERISDYYQGACDESDSHGSQSIVRADAEQWYNKTFGGNNEQQ